MNACLPLQRITYPYFQAYELRQLGATLSLANRDILEPDHIVDGFLNGSSNARKKKLRYSRLILKAARKLLNDLSKVGIRAA